MPEDVYNIVYRWYGWELMKVSTNIALNREFRWKERKKLVIVFWLVMLHITQRINYPIPHWSNISQNKQYNLYSDTVAVLTNFTFRHIVAHERSCPTRQSKHVLLDAVRRKGLDQNESHQLLKYCCSFEKWFLCIYQINCFSTILSVLILLQW